MFKDSMEDWNNIGMRRLLEGERVEVRQKERGLRGSWHSGVVVKVKYGRRVVQYDELFTLDGSKKLKECIPLCESRRFESAKKRDSCFDDVKPPPTRIEQDKNDVVRGFIRPIPPPCSFPSKQNWKRGLLVDAFYNDAWWEGILLDDVASGCEELKTKIFFPEEGDEQEILLKDLRISQEWDEASGLWATRGYWFFESGLDLSPLKEICTQTKSPLKALWRRKRFCSPEDLSMQEQRINNQSAKITMIEEATPQLQTEVQQPLHDISETPGLTISTETQTWEEDLSKNGDHCEEDMSVKEGQKCTSSVENTSSNIKPEEKSFVDGGHCTSCTTIPMDSVNSFPQIPPLDDNKYDVSNQSPGQMLIETSKKRKLDIDTSLNEDGQCKGRVSSRIAQKICEVRTRKQNCDQNKDENQEVPTTSTIDVNTVNGQLSSQSTGAMDENESTDLKIHLPLKVRVRQARLAAKTFLLGAGWKIDSRLRHRGSALKYEAVYVSPNGSRFFSLASACRGLMTDGKVSSSLFGGMNGVLNAYSIAESLRFIQTPHAQASTAEQVTDDLTKDKRETNFLTVPDLRDVKNGNIIPHEKDKGLELSTGCKKEAVINQNNVTVLVEKLNKRKNGGSCAESKRKRGRSSLKGSQLLHENMGSNGKGGCRMQVLLSFPEKGRDQNYSGENGGPPQFKKSTVLSWLIDKGVLKEDEPVCYINRKDRTVVKKGRVTREGVMCDCCQDVFTLSNFEAHAGSKLHRPSANIFLDDGRSISDCQLEACALQDAKEKEGIMDVNDDTCGVCGDGGELVLCDFCPSTFHAGCIGLTVIPEGDWHCPRCSCGICGTNQQVGELDNRMLRCVQCELEYHLNCVPASSILSLNQATQKIWFCNRRCQEIFIGLRRLVGVLYPMENGFSWMLLRSMKKDHAHSKSTLEVLAEHHSKLSVAHGVMQECFVPMIDPRTKINIISQALYNRRSKFVRLNYGGFYTMLLEKGDEIISVAAIRVHGSRLAEMPLVGTRYQYRRQGMCRRLMHALEEMLKNLGVEKLILPAVPELLDTWTNAFGFQKMSLSEIQGLSNLNLMTFPGTSLLQKFLLGPDVSRLPHQPHNSDAVGSLENSSCKSVEDLQTLPHTSSENDVLEGNINGDISLTNTIMLDYMQDVPSYDPDAPQVFAPSRAGRPKNRIRHKADIESPIPVLTDANELEDDVNTSVVIGTTRSKRLVKSRRWVADGLRELIDSRFSRRNSAIEANTGISASDPGQGQQADLGKAYEYEDIQDEVQFMKNVYVRTRRKTSSVSIDTVKDNGVAVNLVFSRSKSMDVSPFESQNLNIGKDDSKLQDPTVEDLSILYGSSNFMQPKHQDVINELQFCPKFYMRRKKRCHVLEDSTASFRSGQLFLEQPSIIPHNNTSQESLSSTLPVC